MRIPQANTPPARLSDIHPIDLSIEGICRFTELYRPQPATDADTRVVGMLTEILRELGTRAWKCAAGDTLTLSDVVRNGEHSVEALGLRACSSVLRLQRFLNVTIAREEGEIAFREVLAWREIFERWALQPFAVETARECADEEMQCESGYHDAAGDFLPVRGLRSISQKFVQDTEEGWVSFTMRANLSGIDISYRFDPRSFQVVVTPLRIDRDPGPHVYRDAGAVDVVVFRSAAAKWVKWLRDVL